MSKIFDKIWGTLKPRHDDDFVDRANYVYTATMFLLCGVTIASKQYVGKPIQCWVPPHFKRDWEQYTENFCFVENTYWVAMDERFPRNQQDRDDREIAYYQWVPLLLGLQMLACFLPKILFNSLNFRAGYSVERMVAAASKISKEKDKFKFKESKTKDYVNYFSKVLATRANKILSNRDSGKLKKIQSIYYYSADTSLYMLYKLLNLVVSLAQVYLLNRMLWPDYEWHGYTFVQDLMNNKEWKQSGEFPRVTFCDIDIRGIEDNPVRYTIQCVLQINMFNEKVYVFIWFWLLILSFLNAFNLVYWIWSTYFSFNLINFIDRHLTYSIRKGKPAYHEVSRFVKDYLFMDGVTALRLLELNTDVLITSELVNQLWKNYTTHKQSRLEGKTYLEADTNSDEDESGFYHTNLMSQSVCTNSTSASGASTIEMNYCNASTLPSARLRVNGGYPMSNV